MFLQETQVGEFCCVGKVCYGEVASGDGETYPVEVGIQLVGCENMSL